MRRSRWGIRFLLFPKKVHEVWPDVQVNWDFNPPLGSFPPLRRQRDLP